MRVNPFAPLRPLPLIIAYGILLHWTYQTQIAPIFGYLGSRYRTPDPINYFFAGVIVAILALAMPRTMRRPSDFVLWVLYVMAAIPAILVPQYADILPRDKSLILAAVVGVNFLLVTVLTRLEPAAMRLRTLIEPHLMWTFLGIISVLVYGYLYLKNGLDLTFAQDLSSVRDVRFGYRQQVADNGALLGYLIRLQGTVINPLLVVKGATARRWWLIVAGTLGQIVIFGMTGYKLTLLSAPALLAVLLMFRWSKNRRGSLVLWGVTVTSVIALVVDQLRGLSIIFTELFVDRLLLVPGTLTAAHVLVFDGHQKMLWSYSFMSPFIHNSYGTTPAFIVGTQFSGDPQTTANANFFADGFANLGWSGMTVEALVLVVLLWVVDAASKHLPLKVSASLMLVPALSLVNSSVFTSILTGGIAAVILLMMMLPEDGWGEPDSPDPGPVQEPAYPKAEITASAHSR